MRTRLGVVLGGVLAALLLAAPPAHADYANPGTLQARVTETRTADGGVLVQCRLDAGTGRAVAELTCALDRLDPHWYGDSDHELWRWTTAASVPHARLITYARAGVRCAHGVRYQARAYGHSTGVLNTVQSGVRTTWRALC